MRIIMKIKTFQNPELGTANTVVRPFIKETKSILLAVLAVLGFDVSQFASFFKLCKWVINYTDISANRKSNGSNGSDSCNHFQKIKIFRKP